MFNTILKNPKTSIPALIAGLVQLLSAFGVIVDPSTADAITAIMIVLIGLFARDGDKSSEAVGIK